eukprot:scaffold304_cov80-Skeletonema_menzelii.AAC.18
MASLSLSLERESNVHVGISTGGRLDDEGSKQSRCCDDDPWLNGQLGKQTSERQVNIVQGESIEIN